MRVHAEARLLRAALGIVVAGVLAAGCTASPGVPRAAVPTPTPTPTTGATATPSPPPSPMPTATASPAGTPTPTPTATPTQGPTPDGQAREAEVPILMYHYISDLPPDADAIRRDLTVAPADFEAQLAYLRDAGYTGVTLDDLIGYLAAGRPLPAKPVVLTFDDGYADAYSGAFPLLKQYGFPGTFFVITSFLDEGRPGYLTWEQAAQMQAAGMEIEAHSVTHPDLTGLGDDALVAEVQGAREAIEAHLHAPVRYFCYPSGRYDQRTIAALQAAGYWAAVTTAGGSTHTSGELFELARVRVHGGGGAGQLEAALAYYAR